MKSFLKRWNSVVIMIVVVIAVFGSGIYVGRMRTASSSSDIPSSIVNGDTGKPGNVDFSLFWKAWQDLDAKYVATHGNSTTTDQDKVWGAIKGLADSYGDPYTTFFPPVAAGDFKTEISGNFDGIGAEVGMKDGIIIIIAPLKDTPAYKAGAHNGDEILKINATSTTNMTIDQAVSLMRGKKGTTVTLTLLGPNDKQPRVVNIIRDTINIPTLDYKMRPDGIFDIQLYNFSENSNALFKDAIYKFYLSGSDKLIIDLRGNPGGYLESAVDMASWFLPSNDIVVTEDAGGHGTNTVYKSFGYNVFAGKKLKVAILVDGGSASASEILAGALRENGVAKLVGEQTFGKGSVQELVDLTPETYLKITIARWLTPKGNSISDHGLTPDYKVSVTQSDIDKSIDAQLNKAVDLLNTNSL